MSGRGALAGGVMLVALFFAVQLMSAAMSIVGLGGGMSAGETFGFFFVLTAGTAVAGMIAFQAVNPWLAGAYSVAGHVVGVGTAYGPAGWVGSLTDSIAFPVAAVSVVGVSVAAALAARRVTPRLVLTAAGLLAASLVAALGGSGLVLLSLPVLAFASWALLPATVGGADAGGAT